MQPSQTALIVVDAEKLIVTTSLGAAGAAADQAATQSTFADYRQRKAARTLQAHDQDLARFVAFLANAGVRADAHALAHEPDAWTGITWGWSEGLPSGSSGRAIASPVSIGRSAR